MGVLVYMHELISCIGILDKINKNQIFLPSASKAYKMAAESSEFLSSQLKAVTKRINSILPDIIKHFIVFGISLLILNQNLKRKAEKAVSSVAELIPKYSTSSNVKEISFVSFFYNHAISRCIFRWSNYF